MTVNLTFGERAEHEKTDAGSSCAASKDGDSVMVAMETINIFPNPASDLIAVQAQGLVGQNILIELYDMTGRKVLQSQIEAGSTIAYFDVETLYSGAYVIKLSSNEETISKRVIVSRP